MPRTGAHGRNLPNDDLMIAGRVFGNNLAIEPHQRADDDRVLIGGHFPGDSPPSV